MGKLARLAFRGKVILAVFAVLALALAGCGGKGGTGAPAAASQLTIGITKIVDHPALDSAQKGFIDYLTENGYGDTNFVVKSAQGEPANAQAIAKDFVNSKVDMILAIATPTLQAAVEATTAIPILFTAVTDPVAAGAVDSYDRPGGNVTGTSDLNPVADQLKLFNTLPTGVKKVGIIYNSGETNSVIQVDLAKAAAPDLGLTVVEAVATNQTEVLTAAQSLIGKVDGLYVPGDNTAVAAMASIIQVAEAQKWPIIAAESSVVEGGGLATIGIDYYSLGRQTGAMAVRVLKGESTATMPVEYQDTFTLVINTKAAGRIGMSLSQDQLAGAEIIEK